MKLEAEVNSGAAYLMSLASVVILGIVLKAPFSELFLGIGSLYGWHTGRRLMKDIKLKGCNGNGDKQLPGQDTPAQ